MDVFNFLFHVFLIVLQVHNLCAADLMVMDQL